MNINEPRVLLEQATITMQRTIENKYSVMEKELNKTLSYKHNPLFSVVSIYVIFKMVEKTMQEITDDLESTVAKQIETAYLIGVAMGLSTRYKLLGISTNLESLMTEALTMIDSSTLIALKNVTMQDLLQVTRNTEYSIKKLVRDTMSKHLNVQNMLNMDRKDLAEILIKELQGVDLQKLINKNMTAIVDKSGRRWSVENYVDMVTTTKAQQVYVEGLQEFSKQNNGKGDLARIPVNNAEDNCRHYEGMIISMTGATSGYKTYAELKASKNIFHPRCRHNPIPYWDETAIPEDYKEKHSTVLLHANDFERKQMEEKAKKSNK